MSALLALYNYMPNMPLETKLPEPFSTRWKLLNNEKKKLKLEKKNQKKNHYHNHNHQ